MNHLKLVSGLLFIGSLWAHQLNAQGIDNKSGNGNEMGTVTVERVSPKIAKVTFANPPVNLITPETVSSLDKIVTQLSADPQIQVVIFSSSLKGYFFNHFDLSQAAAFPVSVDSLPVWTNLVIKLSKAPFISIGSIRGRTRGGGNELALAMDLRYASKEQAIFGQPEVGTGILPGGGGSERLPRLIGHDRASEIILSSSDYDAETAEQYGLVTRTLPDAELDSFVDSLSRRLASFDKEALVTAKTQVNRASLPPEGDLYKAYSEYSGAMQRARVKKRLSFIGKASAVLGAKKSEKDLGGNIVMVNKLFNFFHKR